MSPTDLAELFENHPTTPFRLTLSSGDVVEVDNPGRTIIEGLSVYIGQAEDPAARIAQRLRVVSIPNIALVEKMDPRRYKGRRRR